MQPIFSDPGLLPFLAPLPALAIMVFATWLVIYAAKRNRVGLLGIACILLTSSALGAIVVSGIVGVDLKAKTTEARLAEVEAVYGVSLPEDAYRELEYPDERPETDSLQAFGTAFVTYRDDSGVLSQTQMTLIWEDGEFGLFSGEGAVTELEELPRVG